MINRHGLKMRQPEVTLLSFGGLTALDKAFTDINNLALARLNLFWCEVLNIRINDDKEISFDFHLTKSILSRKHLKSLNLDSLEIFKHYYEKEGLINFIYK